MQFISDEHKTAYTELFKSLPDDVYHKSLAYLLTLDNVCRRHISELFNLEERTIIPAALSQPWQTGTSLKTTRLAFNLYTGYVNWCPDEDLGRCSAAEIFCCSYAPYYWEAIKIRYPEYTRGD